MSSASGILVEGTSSDAGTSVIVAGLCRALASRGVRVTPFTPHHMSNTFRRAWLAQVPAGVGSEWTPVEGVPCAARRKGMLETLADALEEHSGLDALLAHTRIGRPS